MFVSVSVCVRTRARRSVNYGLKKNPIYEPEMELMDFLQGIVVSFTGAHPSSLFSYICGLNYFKDLVGDCVCWV